MKHAAARIALSLVMIAVAGAFLWYGVLSYGVQTKDSSFISDHSSSELFPEAWLLRGNMAYFVDMNSPYAALCFRKAIAIQPLMIEAWLALTQTELSMGNTREAHQVFQSLVSPIRNVSTWKWQELLLAYDMKDEAHFAYCFNFILSRLPRRMEEACFLAQQFWGGWSNMVPHVTAENRPVFLKILMKGKHLDAALDLWNDMDTGNTLPDDELSLTFCHFLLQSGKVTLAKQIWSRWRKGGESIIYDGGLELEPLRMGFGWYMYPHKNVSIERSRTAESFEGDHCLHLGFDATRNITLDGILQIVPVTPGKTYMLSFARKSSNLTTDKGIYIQLTGHGCTGLDVRSKALSGTVPWHREQMEVKIPDTCEAMEIRVRRAESLMLDNRISGDYWLDDLRMTPVHQ